MIADDVYGQNRSRKMQDLAMKRELDETGEKRESTIKKSAPI